MGCVGPGLEAYGPHRAANEIIPKIRTYGKSSNYEKSNICSKCNFCL